MSNRWGCHACGEVSDLEQLLTAKSPFDPDDNLTACPRCKRLHELYQVCDEPGCKRETSCGFLVEDGGYRRTCSTHATYWSKK